MEQQKRKGLFGKLKDGYYRFKFFRRIEKSYVLVTRNIFNGKKVGIKEGGFAFLFPWTETKAVSIKEKDIDYKPDVFEDRSGMDLTLDNVITVKITDPIKYEYEHSDIEGRLKNLLDSKLREMLKKYPYEFLALKGFHLPPANSVVKYKGTLYMDAKFVNGRITGREVPTMEPEYDEKGKFDKLRMQACFISDLANLRYELDQFEQKYGLSLVNFECKKIMPSEEVRKQQEELKLSEDNIKISKNKAEAKRISAAADADAESIRFKTIIELLKETNLSPEEQGRFMYAYMYSSGSNQDVAKSAAAAVSGATAGMVAAQVQNNNDNQKTK